MRSRQRLGAPGQRLGGGFDGGSVLAAAATVERNCRHQRVDLLASPRRQQVAIGVQRALRGQQHAVGIHPASASARAFMSSLRGLEAVLQHPGDLLVVQAVDGLTSMRASTPLPCSLALTPQSRPSASTVKVTRMRAAPAAMGGNAAQLEARQAAAVGHQVALTLHHMQRQRRLAILVGGEVLRLGGGNGFVARGRCAPPARPWSRCPATAGSRPAAAGRPPGCCPPAGWPGWPRPAPPLHRVEVGQRFTCQKSRPLPLHLGHAGGAAHHDHALHVVGTPAGVAQALRTAASVRRSTGVAASKSLRAEKRDCQPPPARPGNATISVADKLLLGRRARRP
jgi:hypothetical protein